MRPRPDMPACDERSLPCASHTERAEHKPPGHLPAGRRVMTHASDAHTKANDNENNNGLRHDSRTSQGREPEEEALVGRHFPVAVQ